MTTRPDQTSLGESLRSDKRLTTMRNISLLGIAMVILLVGAVAVYAYNEKFLAPVPVTTACTEEAKVCPDGSSVGRTGPNCEFTPCPTAPAVEKEITTVALNETAYTFGIHITPLEVLEDSRCPKDVQCIQAGTVRIRAKLQSDGGSEIQILTLGSPTNFLGKRVTLMAVEPAKYSKTPISSSDYRFTFQAVNGMAQAQGRIAGSVTISPICPVEQANNPCKPTPQQYASHKIGIYTADKKKLLTTITPGADGSFSIAMDVGTYYANLLEPKSSIGSVSGVPATFTVRGGESTRLNIAIDTGIR